MAKPSTELSDASLFEASVPSAMTPSLELIAALSELMARAEQAGAPSAAQLAEASALRAQLLRSSPPLHEQLPARLRPDGADYRRWFSEAVLLWASFAETGGAVLIETVGGSRLDDFPIDFRPASGERERLRDAVARVFGWNGGELAQLEQRIEGLIGNVRLKQAITSGLRALVEAVAPGDLRRGALALMADLYGPVPFRYGDVDLVLSSSAAFLCVPHANAALRVAGYAERPQAERDAIAEFLKRVDAAQQSFKSVRFPAFGLFDETAVSSELKRRLTLHVQRALPDVSAERVAATLKTMVTVLPTQDLAKYAVHDAWGHGWQEMLCEFEWVFEGMPRIPEPLSMDGCGPFADGTQRLADAFEIVAGETRLREAALLQCVETDLRQRIRVGMNLVVSEALADLMEHKPARVGAPLPSSSLLPNESLKLDLSLTDARRMLRAWRKPYRALHKVKERERMCAELTALGFPEAGRAQAMAQAGEAIERRFGLAFEDGVELRPGDDVRQPVNTLQRIMLGMAGFDAALHRFLDVGDGYYRAAAARRGGSLPRWLCPPACIDLVALLLAWFYEQERALHVWHLDELLNGAFMTTLQQLEAELLR